MIHRRRFLQHGTIAAGLLATPGASRASRFDPDAASEVLSEATAAGLVRAASLCVRHDGTTVARAFGQARSADDPFLLGSISKPMSVAALLTLLDRGDFQLDDPAHRYLPEFQGEGRERVTVRHLLTHVSGLPDQLPENDRLRAAHAGLPEFVEHATRTPPAFEPGTQYRYSSMGILLASEIARRLSGKAFSSLMDEAVFRPLGMDHSALGLGRFSMDELTPCQTDRAAPESGGGDPAARDWDWNSPYWRGLGAPWGGVHASAPDVARFLAEFLDRDGACVRPETARLATRNQNRPGLTPRGLGLAIGADLGGPGCSEQTFGHTGSTGTLAWADPDTLTICVILTSLPALAVDPHPRTEASRRLAQAISRDR